MYRALVKASTQDDKVQVKVKVIQQGNLALPSEESVCPVCKQANPLLHQFRAGLNVCGRKRHHNVLSEKAVVSQRVLWQLRLLRDLHRPCHSGTSVMTSVMHS